MAVQLLWILVHLLLLVQLYVFTPILNLLLIFKNLFLLNGRYLTSFQTILTQINHAIGAEGVVSSQCKKVVSDFGTPIWERLIEGASSFIDLQYRIFGVSSFDLIFFISCSYIQILFAKDSMSVHLIRHLVQG